MPADPVAANASTLDQTNDRQIKDIVEHLQWRYTREQISLPDLSARVNGFYHQFDTVRIRTFVTILVEGLVRRSIPVVLPGRAT
jgi:hypothetical protein